MRSLLVTDISALPTPPPLTLTYETSDPLVKVKDESRFLPYTLTDFSEGEVGVCNDELQSNEEQRRRVFIFFWE